MMETQKVCPNCRKPLPPDVPLGLCPECLIKSGFPTEGGGGISGEAAGARFVPPPVEEIAQLFPQLEILGLIGKGGMGAVYKARQPALDRFVALKVLPPAVGSDPGFAERFNREARALARLNHPNIVAVHDFGKTGPLHYLIMEFVDGTNLREVEHAGRLSPEQALAIVPQICEALQFAHNEGIVHRDIKPENLLLDKKGRVKITDFGIAKIVGAPPGKVSLTGVKDVVGTPHYMAPEQIEQPQTVDHRADIYSLGVVFYEMLTGELPLGKFSPPSKKVQIDVRLDDVVLHTLEKEPARRYQQVNQLKTDVETISGTVPPAAGLGIKGNPAPLLATPSDKATSDKIILPAFLLAFFFGPFGAHRFYVGKTGTAILQLCTFGACGIWSTIDWILILCKAFTDGQGRRITNWLHPQNGELKTGANPPGAPPSTPPPGGTPPASKPGPTLPPAVLVPENTPGHVPGKIVAPAVGLMVGAGVKLLGVIFNTLLLLPGGRHWLNQIAGEDSLGWWGSTLIGSTMFFELILALFILFGAFQMLRLRSYAWAVAASILCIVSCGIISMAMGVWALIVLARQDVRDAFERRSKSPPAPAGVWPWLIGIIVVIVMIMGVLVIGPIASCISTLHGIDRTFNAGATDTGGSSTPVTAIPLPPRGYATATPTPPAPPENAAPAPALPPVRIKAGSSSPITDSEGNLWLADQGFTSGQTTERSDSLAIANTKDPMLYKSERYSMTSFSYPVPNGKYVVKLHFAETYDAIKGPGGRVFTFIVEGHEFRDFDVWAKAGGAQRACVETVNVDVTDGRLDIYFIPQTENPEINGIEILPAPSANGNSGSTMNISSQNGQVVIETTNGRLTADKVTLRNESNNSITMTASKINYVVAPSTPTTPTPPVQPVPPAPPTVMSSQSTVAGAPSKPQMHQTKVLASLTTSDAFQQDFNRTLPLSANGRIRLNNVNGRVEIVGWDGSDVVIKALKHGKTQKSVGAVKINVNSSPDEIAIHTDALHECAATARAPSTVHHACTLQVFLGATGTTQASSIAKINNDFGSITSPADADMRVSLDELTPLVHT